MAFTSTYYKYGYKYISYKIAMTWLMRQEPNTCFSASYFMSDPNNSGFLGLNIKFNC